MIETIEDFYNSKISNITYSNGNSKTVEDFYNDFVLPRLPKPQVVKEWHKLLVKYAEKEHIFFVRKYESKKNSHGKWDNRRGAVVRFADDFEIVYSSNFLAHEIFLMACNGFVPQYDDFKSMVDSRRLHITSGTKIEKKIRLYPSSNKTISAYLAHIEDVNGTFLRDDGTYLPISRKEAAVLFPLGTASNWENAEKIYKLDYALSDEEKDLVKAHFLRFLDPMNYFPTPQTSDCTHSVYGFKKNIGELTSIINIVYEENKKRLGKEYTEFIKLTRFTPVGNGETITGSPLIDLHYEYKSKKQKGNLSAPASLTNLPKEKTKKHQTVAAASKKADVFYGFKEFLLKTKSSNTVNSYISKIRKVSGGDTSYLEKNLDGLIKQWQTYKGDHGTTYNSLKQYREYIKL